MNFERPDNVREAQLRKDKEALKAMGRKGGRASAESRAFRAAIVEEAKQQELADARYQELVHEHGEERAEQIIKDSL